MPLVRIKQEEGKTSHTAPCLFCHRSDLDELNLGPLYQKGDIIVHYFCLLFSSGLSQNGKEDEGILGFRDAEIWKEIRRSTRLKCTFCGVKGASIGCGKGKCNVSYHFPCGLNNLIQFQFIDSYESFCAHHYTAQILPYSEEGWKCSICLEYVEEDDDDGLMALCCKAAVFHKQCVKKMALNAGYFFKCAVCNNKDVFVEEVRLRGVFVPEQDASWEKEPNAFAELYVDYTNCDSETCYCPDGRTFKEENGNYSLARCTICGSSAIHKRCGNLINMNDWSCKNCTIVESVQKVAPELPKASSSSSSKKGVDIGKITISEWCHLYFPHGPEQMVGFKNKYDQMIPDWRNFVLRVNLVDWIRAVIKKNGGNSYETRITRNMIPVEPVSKLQVGFAIPRCHFAIDADQDDKLKKSKTSKDTNGDSKLKKTKKKRGSQWRRGVVGKYKKKSSAKRSLSDTTSELQISSSEASFQVNEKTEVESTSVPCTPPEKKRKIIELGHNIYASGLNRDLYVQQNVEIDESFKSNPNSAEEIGMEALIPLRAESNEEVMTAISNVRLLENGKENRDCNADTDQRNLSHGVIDFEHSYCKNI